MCMRVCVPMHVFVYVSVCVSACMCVSLCASTKLIISDLQVCISLQHLQSDYNHLY